MKWLTKKEIVKRAQKSPKEALLVSIEHHQQIAKATRKEFFEAVGSGKVTISASHCGICQIIAECYDCFLSNGGSCCEEWREIRDAINDILVNDGFWPAVVKAEKIMIKRLKKELAK